MIDSTDILNRVAQREEFARKCEEFARLYSFPVEWLYFIMDFESAGTMKPDKWNQAGYVGLIQFGSQAAQDLNTTTFELSQMSVLKQLDYVFAYFEMWIRRKGNHINSIADLYLLVLWPDGYDKPNDYKISMPQQAKGLYDHYGNISKNSINDYFESRYNMPGRLKIFFTTNKKIILLCGAIILILIIFIMLVRLQRFQALRF